MTSTVLVALLQIANDGTRYRVGPALGTVPTSIADNMGNGSYTAPAAQAMGGLYARPFYKIDGAVGAAGSNFLSLVVTVFTDIVGTPTFYDSGNNGGAGPISFLDAALTYDK